ncbi:exocrine gland-secreted peptide 1-like [Arvicanthis niloticus]|uniref:exocrine gland-secreted peptide 1-like n=1 Tax=Arvicanthis niloticus TaxID=61156 RepID=UPI001487126B|nr:exocrine gland-secreted peptide 1-like [Arvicanthis niloticus]
MASFPMMMFLIILLLPHMLAEGRVLIQIQTELTISADHKNIFDLVKCLLEKVILKYSNKFCKAPTNTN